MPSPLVEKFMYLTPLRIYIYSHQFSPSTHKQPDYQNFHFYFFTLTASLLLQETITKKKEIRDGFLRVVGGGFNAHRSSSSYQRPWRFLGNRLLLSSLCWHPKIREQGNLHLCFSFFLLPCIHNFIYIYISSLINIFRCTQLVFVVFTPCIMFANLAQTVTLQDIISWYALPIFTHRYEKTCGFDLSKISFAGGLCP